MRSILSATLGIALGSDALLTACAGNAPVATSPLPPPALKTALPKAGADNALPFLFVSDPENQSYQPGGDIAILHNGSYKVSGIITAGLERPFDLFVDKQRNLYAADFGNNGGGAGTVTEYAPESYGNPLFTYSSGLYAPTAVAVDTSGNVFVAQYYIGGGLPGGFDEFSQRVNTPIANCSALPEGSAWGIAVDSNDDVFETWRTYGSEFALFEYVGGELQGCDYQNINLPLSNPWGLAIDKHNNLLISDGSEVKIVDPPYTKISGVLASGFGQAVAVHLNSKNTLAYVTDEGGCKVDVLNYPSGSLVKVVGAKDDFVCPQAAVDASHAVY
jgi:hypothetical protein